jgi:hypothetical protein
MSPQSMTNVLSNQQTTADNRSTSISMKTKTVRQFLLSMLLLPLGISVGLTNLVAPVIASGGSGGGGTSVDTIKVSKCYYQAGSGQMLIKASSSDSTARLFAYRPDGSYIGEVQNGGGSRYGGTVMPWQPYDPVNVTIISTSGGSTTVPTTPFQI